MYAINGVPVTNPTYGWELRKGSKPIFEGSNTLQSLRYPGRDGVEILPATKNPPVGPLIILTPRAYVDALLGIFSQPVLRLSKASSPTREIVVELMGYTYAALRPADAIVDITFTLRAPGVFWRDVTAVTSTATAISSASVVHAPLSGLTQPVRDCLIRVKGGVSGLRITDSGGDWVEYGATVPNGSWWIFDAARARAYVVTTDTWDVTTGVDVTGVTDWSGEDYPFEIRPKFTSPVSTAGELTVTTTARVGSPTIEVRGKRAYAVSEV